MATSSVSRTRATNLTGLIDIDSLVEANLLRQKTKLNTAIQDKKIQEYKQQQYREITTKADTFYNKYCDILSGNGLFGLNTNAYNIIKYTSSNSNAVTAIGDTNAKAINYKVNVEQVATSAKCEIAKSTLKKDNVLRINGETFTLRGENEKEIVKNLNSDLTNKGVGVTATYSDFVDSGNGGLLLETTEKGASAVLNIGKASGTQSITVNNPTSGTYKETDKMDISKLADGDKLDVNGERILLRGNTNEERVANLISDINNNSTLKDKIQVNTADIDDGSGNVITGIRFSSKIAGTSGEDLNIKVPDGTGQEPTISYYTINNATVEEPGYATSDEINLTSLGGKTLVINKTEINIPENATLDDINNALSSTEVIAIDSGDGKIKLQSKTRGDAGKFTSEIVSGLSNASNGSALGQVQKGLSAKFTITDMNTGTKIKRGYDGENYDSNEIKLDGVTFNFTDKTDGDVTLTGKKDATELTDKIVEFINDYNDLLGTINTKLYEEYDKSYKPLTDDDKEGLTDSEIQKLEEKAQTGLLRNDRYLTEFADSMKNTMTKMLEGSGISIEKLGIKPVNDYTSQNGLFTVPTDTTELAETIAANIDEVKKLFSSTDGIFSSLGKNLKDNAVGSTSKIGQYAGIANTSSATNSVMSKDIAERKTSIANMQTMLQEKENNLYTKYSKLESSLASLQSQQSTLSSYFS